MEKFFHLKENGTTVSTEILAGLTTFFAMAYIIVVNPQILSQTGMPWGGVFLATIIAAIAASTTAMMSHFTKFGSFFICYILSWFSVGRGCGRGPAVPPPPTRKAVSPTPGALLRPGRCCQLPQSWQGRYRCGHSMR